MPRYALTEDTKHFETQESIQVQKYNVNKNKTGYFVQVLKWDEKNEIYKAVYTFHTFKYNFEDNTSKIV
jgi:hypothetical protein